MESVINSEHLHTLSFKEKLINYFKDYNSLIYYVLFLIIFGIAFYAGSLFLNNFTITPTGDFVVQTISFFYNGYDDWHRFLATGEFPFWDSNLFLGSDNLAGNAFYYVCNPFFLFCTLFPRDWLIHMIAITIIAKLVLATLFFRLLLKSFNVKEWTARFFAICYGFGGWLVYYTWFNVFLDVGTFLPLILLGIEKVLKREKPFLLIFSIFLLGITNFYFLVPICIGAVLYALFRLVQTWKTRTTKDSFIALGIGVASFALGLALAGFLIFPALFNSLQYTRAQSSYLDQIKAALDAKEYSTVLKMMFDWSSYTSSALSGFYASTNYGFRIIYPLISFLFPPSDGRNVSILEFSGNRYDEVASSLFCYTPCIIIFFASIFKSIKERKISHLIAIAFMVFCLFVPFCYYFFLAFSSCYGRWEILPYAFLLIYIAIQFNDRNNYKLWYFDVSYIITAILMIACVYYVYLLPDIYPSRIVEPGYRWAIIVVQALYVTFIYVFIRFKYKKPNFIKYGQIFLLAECIMMGVYFTISHGYVSYNSSSLLGGITNFTRETEIFNRLKDEDDDLYDPSFYRVQSGRIVNSGTNIAQLEDYNGTSFFQSTYNPNLDQFISWSRMVRSPGNWVGEAIQKKPLLDEFLGVKYYLTKAVETNFGVNENKVVHVEPNIPFGYEKKYSYYDYDLYENKNFIEMGFSFDTVLDPNLTDPNDKYHIYSDFYRSYALNELDNDYNFLTTATYSTEDIAKIKDTYDDDFNSGSLSETNYKNLPNLVTYRRGTDYTSKVYRLSSNFDPQYPLAYLTDGDTSDQTSNLTYAKDIVVFEPRKTDFFTLESDPNCALFINKSIDSSHRVAYFLIDEEGNAITYDNNLLFGSSGWYRYMRTLYSQGKNISTIIAVSYPYSDIPMTLSSVAFDNLYRWQYTDYMDVINSLKEYPLENCSHSVNNYSFTTNFDKRRIIVTNVAYDGGWSVKATKNGKTIEKETFKADGGWLSFVSETGETSYSCSFVSQHFKTGVIAGGIAVLSVVFLGIHYYIKSKNYLEKTLSQKKKFTKIFNEELKNLNK